MARYQNMRHPAMRRRGKRRSPSPDFLTCPECGKRNVTLRLTGEDHWGCRTRDCDWYAFTSGNDEPDVRARRALAEANPGHDRLAPDGINRW